MDLAVSHADLLAVLRNEPDPVRLAVAARSLHPADIAVEIGQMDPDRRLLIFACLDDAAAAEVLDELAPHLTPELLADLPLARASDIIEEMPPDEAADLLNELEPGNASAILQAMELEDAADVRELLDYQGDTAGGQMTTEFVAIEAAYTVEETIQCLRELAPEAETIYYLFVVDTEERLAGVLSLRALIVADPHARISDIMSRDVISVSADADQEEAADLIARYNLVAVPVVDDDGRPIGIITVDDAVDVIDEEAAEDVHEVGGAGEEPGSGLLDVLSRRMARVAGPTVAALTAGVVLWLFMAAVPLAPAVPIPASTVQSLPWIIAAFLPAMMMLSWLFQSQAWASLASRLAGGGELADVRWLRLTGDVTTTLILAMLCAIAVAGLAYVSIYGSAAAPALECAAVGAGLAVGLAVSSAGAYVVPRILLKRQAERQPLGSGVAVIAHALGIVAYIVAAFKVGRL